MSFWACAQTRPRSEAAAAHFLALRGYEIYLPRLRQVRLDRGRKIETRPPLFPAYLFIWITAGWWSAKWCPRVVRVLAAGDGPVQVPQAIVDAIRAREVGGLVELPEPPLRRGARVKILRGPFAGHLAVFADMRPRQRVEVLLALLGGQQRVTLAKKDIEVVR
jgi:transcriptional antiterminator RfaH